MSRCNRSSTSTGVITLVVTLILFKFMNATAGDAYRIGAARLGAIYVLMNGDTTHYAADYVMRDCEPVLVLASLDSAARRCAASLDIPIGELSCSGRPAPEPVPGSEFILYREFGDDRFFGSIVYANPGAFFGYFVANYQTPSGTPRGRPVAPRAWSARIGTWSSPRRRSPDGCGCGRRT